MAGLGFGLSGSDTAVGDGAWAVYRNTGGEEPYDLFIGFSVSTDPSTSPSGSWHCGYYGGGGIGMMWAWDESGAPWQGTTFNDGTDTFSTPWLSSALLMPAANQKDSPAGGTYTLNVTGSRNMAAALTPASWGAVAQSFLVCVGDNDGFNIFWDQADEQYNNGIILERYTPYQEDYDLPYVMLGRQNVFNNNKVMRDYYQYAFNHSVGITLQKPIAGRVGLSGTYCPKQEYPRFLSHGGGAGAANQHFGYFYTSSSTNKPVVSEFPVHLGAGPPASRYAGFLNLFRVVAWTMPSNAKYGNQTRYALGFEGGTASTWASGSIPWNSGWTAHPSSSNVEFEALWHTSSFGGIAYMPVTMSNLFEDVSIETNISVPYRGRFGSVYIGNVNSPPPGSTDPVILFTNTVFSGS